MRQIKPMNYEYAQEILAWHYHPPYDFYDLSFDSEDLYEWKQHIIHDDWQHEYVILEDQTLVGYTSLEFDHEELLFGIGLAPAYTGKHLGKEYMEFCIAHAKTIAPYHQVKLCVAAFNTRAIKLYESLGFYRYETYLQPINDQEYPFYRMKKEVNTKQ